MGPAGLGSASVVWAALFTTAAWAAPAGDAQQQRRNVTVLLSDPQGDPLGSAVVVAAAEDGYWLATNQHVVDERGRLCVLSVSGKPEAALVIPIKASNPNNALDLALLWLPARPDAGPGQRKAVARFAPAQPTGNDLPLVVASGYPSPMGANQSRPEYREARGLLLPLLKQPLQGGFDLSSTAAVQKGMSGGGVFLGSDLIGINGTHADPLWPGVLLSETGKPIEPALNERLELVSLAISAPVLQKTLQAAVLPSRQRLRSLADAVCLEKKPSPLPSR